MCKLLTATALGAALLLAGQAGNDPGKQLQAAINKEVVEGDLAAAVELYRTIIAKNGGNRPIAARALLRLAGCYEQLGREEAQKIYQQLIHDYPDQAAEAALARQRLATLAGAASAQASEPTFRKIAIAGKISPQAQLSSDGSRLAMVSGGDVWVINLRGEVSPDIAGTPVRLTEGANATWPLTWSGNGQWIAYNGSGNPTENMFVLPASGGTARKLLRPEPLWWPGPWALGLSSDGSRLAFSILRSDERAILQMVSVDTGETLVRFADPNASEPRFSPDDRYVAYVRSYQGSREVHIVRLADGTDVPVAETAELVRSPVWSPDGSMLAFLVDRRDAKQGERDLWITHVPGTGGTPGAVTKVRLQRFPTRIAGWVADDRIGLLLEGPAHNALYTVALSGGKATQVTPASAGIFLPQWSPDGGRIYFRWGWSDVGFVPAGGGTVTVVRQEGEKVIESLPGGGNHISPDGKRIVFSSSRLWTMPVTGGRPIQLPMKPDLNAWQPRWSPDGRWIAFESERKMDGGQRLDENIFIVSSEGGEPRQLTRHTDCYCELSAWSPTGDSIAYACSDTTIRIIPFSGGEPRTVLKDEGLEHHQGSLVWIPDGSRLLYSARGRIWAVSTAGGEPTAIKTDLDGNILQFALSPDGRTIAFNAPTGGDPELWFMEDFLHLVK